MRSSSSPSGPASLAYRTGFYVGALHGYQTVSEVSPVEGADFCQGFADGIEVVMRWLKQYVAQGGTFDGALGDLIPYFPRLRAWVGNADVARQTPPIQPPGRRERQRRSWEQAVVAALSDSEWLTAKEVFDRMKGRGPQTLHTLNLLLRTLAGDGLIEQSRSVDLTGRRASVARWRLVASDLMAANGALPEK